VAVRRGQSGARAWCRVMNKAAIDKESEVGAGSDLSHSAWHLGLALMETPVDAVTSSPLHSDGEVRRGSVLTPRNRLSGR